MTLDELKDSIQTFEWHLNDWALKHGGNPKTDPHIEKSRRQIENLKNFVDKLEDQNYFER